MKRIKLIEGLKLLDRSEWVSFRKYLLMYCTEESDKYELIQVLYSKRNELTELSDLQELKSPSFEGMSEKGFLNLMSSIYTWFTEWLVWYESKKDGISQEVELVKIYNRRGSYSLAGKTYNRVKKKLADGNKLDLNRHKNLYQLYHNHYFSDNPVKNKRKGEFLQTLIDYYKLHLKEQGLMYLAEMYNWGNIQNYDYGEDVAIFSEFAGQLNNSGTSDLAAIILRLTRDMDVDSFLALKKEIEEGRIEKNSELYILSSFYMIFFSLRLWNAKKITNPQIVWDAYSFGLESGILLISGKIAFIRYINIVTTLGNKLKSNYGYEFVDKWSHIVEEEKKESMKALGYAHLKFFERKLGDIIPLILGKKFETNNARLRAYALELIGLYPDRKRDYGFLLNKINNFKRVLKTYGDKHRDHSYRVFLNFAKVLELLVKRDFANIPIQIEKYSPILYNSWLEEEIKAGKK